jgi:hypothetical protein
MDNLYKEIKNLLKKKLPNIKWIDWDFGQLSQEKPPVAWPCVLIDFPAASYSNAGDLKQMGLTQIQLRFGFRVYSRAHSSAPSVYENQALEHLKTLKEAHKQLQGFEGDNYSALSRASFNRKPVIAHLEYVLTYETTLFEEIAKQTKVLTRKPDIIV